MVLFCIHLSARSFSRTYVYPLIRRAIVLIRVNIRHSAARLSVLFFLLISIYPCEQENILRRKEALFSPPPFFNVNERNKDDSAGKMRKMGACLFYEMTTMMKMMMMMMNIIFRANEQQRQADVKEGSKHDKA